MREMRVCPLCFEYESYVRMHVDVSDVRVRYSCSLIEVSVRVMMSESALVWRAYSYTRIDNDNAALTLVYSTLPSSVSDVSTRRVTYSRSRACRLTYPYHDTRLFGFATPSRALTVNLIIHSLSLPQRNAHTHRPSSAPSTQPMIAP